MGHLSSLYFWLVDLPFTVIPILIAERRKCKNIALIYVLSFFLGWTIVGGIAALVWALVGETNPERNLGKSPSKGEER